MAEYHNYGLEYREAMWQLLQRRGSVKSLRLSPLFIPAITEQNVVWKVIAPIKGVFQPHSEKVLWKSKVDGCCDVMPRPPVQHLPKRHYSWQARSTCSTSHPDGSIWGSDICHTNLESSHCIQWRIIIYAYAYMSYNRRVKECHVIINMNCGCSFWQYKPGQLNCSCMFWQ